MKLPMLKAHYQKFDVYVTTSRKTYTVQIPSRSSMDALEDAKSLREDWMLIQVGHQSLTKAD